MNLTLKAMLASLMLLLGGLTAMGGEPLNDLDFQKMMQPVPLSAKFTDPGYVVWCGTMVKDDAGKYHLYYSRWKPEGYWVTDSEVAHAVGDSALGPFKFSDLALPPRGRQYWDGEVTHNPTAYRFGKKYYIYYTGNFGDGKKTGNMNWSYRNHQRIGVAEADTPYGPWRRSDKPVIDVSPNADAPDSLMAANPAAVQRPDGSILLAYKAVGKKNKPPFGGPVVHLTATAPSPLGPFTKQLKPIFTDSRDDFSAEDSFIWYQPERKCYFSVLKDNHGIFTKAGRSLTLFTSADGLDWQPARHVLASRLKIQWADGRVQSVKALERPQLLIEQGRPTVLLAAVMVNDWSDTFNVQIPLKFPE